MADTASTFVTPLDAIPARPPLAVVPNGHAQPSESTEPRTWRNAAVGASIGFFLTVLAITAIGTVAGIGAGAALGLGLFVGAFGGIGFGFMMGGMASFARELDGHTAPPNR